ncbi:MAG TPA: DinB family protein [Longimicrobium sp.]|nr:DinB family protein [Longimicrobium sp.]
MTDTAAPAPPNAFGDLHNELAGTRRVLERIPDEHWGWKPHEKSMTLGRLGTHLAEIPRLATLVLGRDEFNVQEKRWEGEPPANRAEVLAAFDQAVAGIGEALAAVPVDGWGKTWTLRMGEQVMLSMPRAAALRTLGINHLVHHRAQLTVYLRLLDVPVPSLYGPSADEARPPAA